MTLDRMLGQTLVVAPPDGWVDGPQDWLDDLQPAGVILFRRNLPDDAEVARAAIERLHAWARARDETLLVSMDEEGGFVTQTSAWFPTPPSARAFAWAGDLDDVRRAFTAYGTHLRALGVNVDYAPVCDVNNNPRNPVIGVRSFGAEADLVAGYARAVHDGLGQAGVLSCAKHFPGHGDTDVDSHLALPVVNHDRARLDAIELVPFRALLDHVPLVMVAHVACPQLGDGTLPATLAPRIATGLLRDDLGFQGVAITDAMDMQGVAGRFGDEEAAVRALLAGCDLLLYCFEIDKPLRARAGLRAAVEAGRIPRARLEAAVARVRNLKAAIPEPRAALGAAPAQRDDVHLREVCRRALRVLDPAGWRTFARAIADAGRVVVAGSPDEVVARFAAVLGAAGPTVEIRALDALHGPLGAPLLVVLGERRPLAPERVAILRRLPIDYTPVALANLLTPEVDAPLVEAYTAILRTADHTDAMLAVAAAVVLDRDGTTIAS